MRIAEFNNPSLGVDVASLQKWAAEVQVTADKTERLTKVVIDLRALKWTDPQFVTIDGIRERCLTQMKVSIVEFDLEPDENFGEWDFSDNIHGLNQFLAGATSYGVAYSVKAYQGKNVLLGSFLRKYGHVDLDEVQKEVPIISPVTRFQMGNSPNRISKPISREIPTINPEKLFTALFAKLEML